jgi:hypothetical protein
MLSIFDKLLEKLMHTRLYKFLTKNQVLYKHQFGFREKHSTTLALIEIFDDIYKKIDNDDYVVGIFLDLQKAFDTVNHTILLDKIYHYGIRGVAYDWIKNYLSQRKQYVTINGCKSSIRNIEYGVPQGSVLGPLLFLLYINDISSIDPDIKLFADDTNIFLHNKCLTTLFSDANQCLDKLNTWFRANKLSLNIEKTQYCIFKKQKNKLLDCTHLKLTINNTVIERVNSSKYLGITIDDQLSFKEHIHTVVNKIKQFCGIFYKLRTKLPKNCLKQLYFALIHSHINYGIEIYANTLPTNLDPLIKINNKILRIMQFKPYRTHVSHLYKSFNTLTIPLLHQLNIILIIHKYVHHVKDLPEIYQNYFTFNDQIHSHNTRASRSLHIAHFDSNWGRRSIKVLGSQLWNNVPKSTRCLKNFTKFKKAIKQMLIKNI